MNDDFLRRTDDPWQEQIDDAASAAAETPDWLDDEPELLLIRLPQPKEES